MRHRSLPRRSLDRARRWYRITRALAADAPRHTMPRGHPPDA